MISKAEVIRILLSQTAHWAVSSEQEESPFVSLRYANYAVSSMSALTNIVSSRDISKYGKIDSQEMTSYVQMVQNTALKRTMESESVYAAGEVEIN